MGNIVTFPDGAHVIAWLTSTDGVAFSTWAGAATTLVGAVATWVGIAIAKRALASSITTRT